MDDVLYFIIYSVTVRPFTPSPIPLARTTVMFHVATLMPNKETDKNCSNKKRHICNSYVTVVYNDSHDEYKLGTLTVRENRARNTALTTWNTSQTICL